MKMNAENSPNAADDKKLSYFQLIKRSQASMTYGQIKMKPYETPAQLKERMEKALSELKETGATMPSDHDIAADFIIKLDQSRYEWADLLCVLHNEESWHKINGRMKPETLDQAFKLAMSWMKPTKRVDGRWEPVEVDKSNRKEYVRDCTDPQYQNSRQLSDEFNLQLLRSVTGGRFPTSLDHAFILVSNWKTSRKISSGNWESVVAIAGHHKKKGRRRSKQN